MIDISFRLPVILKCQLVLKIQVERTNIVLHCIVLIFLHFNSHIITIITLTYIFLFFIKTIIYIFLSDILLVYNFQDLSENHYM